MKVTTKSVKRMLAADKRKLLGVRAKIQRKRRRVALKRKVYAQVGRSNKRVDRRLKAKISGWRRSASGNKYFENRRNRSDKRKYL